MRKEEMRGNLEARAGDLSRDQLQEMLVRMLRIRKFDERATRLKSDFIPGFLHNSIGQEGEIVGACMALRNDDYMTGNHRSHGHPIGKGIRLAPLMAELFGKQSGVCRGKGGSMHLAAFAVGSLGESGIVGASMPTATGAALSAVMRGTDQVCLCFFGDGAANSGPFHESLNLAALWRAPVIFLCENNGYAGCSPQTQMTSIVDIASRAPGYGMPGVIVDGQDVLAVYAAVSEAVARARQGGGPALIEAKTYRYCDHLEGYQYPKYRPDEEVQLWQTRDPIAGFTKLLRAHEAFTDEELIAIDADVEREVDTAVSLALEADVPDAGALFEDVYA
jgi:acetoin:2,6-dichlorophenolindophenol oxidoreductase subunit alpha